MRDAMTIGVDIAKNTFYLVGLNKQGKQVLRKKLTRNKFLTFFANLPACRVAMEACGGAHHWGRQLEAMGHEMLLLPAQHVKAYARGQKDDYNDAEAIAEAALHGRIHPVRIKTLDEQDMQVLVRIRRRLDKDITALVNHLRGLLQEYGEVIPRGKRAFLRAVPTRLEDAENGLTPRMREELSHGWRRLQGLEAEMARIEAELRRIVKAHEVCRRLLDLPGIAYRNAALLLNHLGDGSHFQRGREALRPWGACPDSTARAEKSPLAASRRPATPICAAAWSRGRAQRFGMSGTRLIPSHAGFADCWPASDSTRPSWPWSTKSYVSPGPWCVTAPTMIPNGPPGPEPDTANDRRTTHTPPSAKTRWQQTEGITGQTGAMKT